MNPCLCNPSTEALTAALRAVAIPRREIECNTRRQEAVSEYLQTPNPLTRCINTPGLRVSAATLQIKKQEKRSGRNRFPLLLHHSPTGKNILHRPEKHIASIQGVGDWKSNSYLTYVRKNIITLFEKARKALASPTAIDSTAVRRMYGSTNSKV